MVLFPFYYEYLVEKFGYTYPKNKWVVLDKEEKNNWKEEIFNLISIAYKPIGGHSNYRKPEDIEDADVEVFKGIDIDDDPEIDLVRIHKNKKYGKKSAGVGHDGEKQSKRKYISSLEDDLKSNGYYIEVSEKISEILISKNVPIISDEAKIRKIINKPDIIFHGEHPGGTQEDPTNSYGWYSRKIGGQKKVKILLGNPKI